MKLMLSVIAAIGFLLFSLNFATAHHMAAGIVDDEVYAMIDELVADTPHASFTFPDMAEPATVTADSVQFMENMIDDGLLNYVGMLDGEVQVILDFNVDGDRQTVYMTIIQAE